MEIEHYMSLYKKHNPEEFFNWLSKGRAMEIRFLSDYKGQKFRDWTLIQNLARELKLESRFNSIYINTFAHLRDILLYKINGYPLTRLYNIFIGVNPKRKIPLLNNNGLIYQSYQGSIAGTSHIQTILCDIEHNGERIGNASHAMLEECIQGAKYLVTLLELEDYYINISGNGVHLWIAMNPAIELPLPSSKEIVLKGKKILKYNLKEEPIRSHIKTYNNFIEKINRNLQEFNPYLKVDEGAKDIARIARPPGSWNVKVGKAPRAVGTVLRFNQINKVINQKFMAAKPLLNTETRKLKEIKIQSRFHRYNSQNITESPLYNLLVSRLLPSTLSRNHYLEQSFARLIRDNNINIDELYKIIEEIDSVQQKAIQVDPDYLDDEEAFNPETINSYCYGCGVDFVYSILEDIPNVTEGFIDEEKYQILNSYSDTTLNEMALEVQKPDTYFELKTLIRNLIDQHDRATVFFTLKKLFKDNWEYMHKNKIILQTINKTRRQTK